MTRGTLFPTITPTEYKRRPKLLQKRVDAAFGDPQINVPHPIQQWSISWNSTFLLQADLDALEAHFLANGTTYFSLYDAWSTRSIPPQPAAGGPITILPFGTVVTGTMLYLIPAKLLTGLALYDNNTLISSSHYTYAENVGTEGECAITFNTGQLPANGHTLSYSAATGQRKFAVYYTNTDFPEAFQEGDVWQLDEPLQFISSLAYT
jgi:hypothetical protein